MRDVIVSGGQYRARNKMRLTRFVRAMGLLLVLGIAAFAIGCGQGAREGGPTAEDKERGKIIKEGKRNFYKQVKESARADTARQGDAMKRGRFRAKSGQ
jgi:hypothetical protein